MIEHIHKCDIYIERYIQIDILKKQDKLWLFDFFILNQQKNYYYKNIEIIKLRI